MVISRCMTSSRGRPCAGIGVWGNVAMPTFLADRHRKVCSEGAPGSLAAVPGGSDVKFAVTFGRMHPRLWAEAAEAADRLGFESAWLPEHLVLPVAMSGSPHAGTEHPPVPPTTQLFDPAAFLSFIAARTTTLRLGTYVYLLGLRHPFVTARAFATLAWVSGGRAGIGAGAVWLQEEWRTPGIGPPPRGARLY